MNGNCVPLVSFYSEIQSRILPIERQILDLQTSWFGASSASIKIDMQSYKVMLEHLAKTELNLKKTKNIEEYEYLYKNLKNY